MFGADYLPSLASSVRSEDGASPQFVARVLARGQGETSGYHERTIPCPPKARRFLASVEARSGLGVWSRERVQAAATVKSSVLKRAILILLQGGPETLKFDDDRVRPFLDSFERAVDGRFFESLFQSVDLDPDEAARNWASELLEIARTVLDEAIRGVPVPSIRRFRAIAQAERAFERSSRKNFPDNFSTEATGETNAADDSSR